MAYPAAVVCDMASGAFRGFVETRDLVFTLSNDCVVAIAFGSETVMADLVESSSTVDLD